MTLNGTWKLFYYPSCEKEISTPKELESANVDCIPAKVPGNVELDLSAAGILPADLFKGMNILEAEKFETYDWWYQTEFDAPEAIDQDKLAILHFGAVDCFADYFLNGEKIGESDNMFIEQDFDVTAKLKYGQKNTLHVHIHSPVLSVKDFDIEPNLLAYSTIGSTLSLYARKAPHSYGWDIMPRALSAGIWRDVELKIQDKYRFKYLYFHTQTLAGTSAHIRMIYDAILPAAIAYDTFTCRVVFYDGDTVCHEYSQTVKGNAAKVLFYLPNAKRWWPKPYGEPHLYRVCVELTDKNGNVVVSGNTRMGVRTLELKRSDIVEPGGAFEFIINGTRIMAVGSNWVPMDAYHSRDKERYARALEMAEDLGCNILRCWGGNVYEDEEFFDFCDEHGIMVWQDFAMACHYYPQTEQFKKKLEIEAESVVKKLRHHPSLVLWCGDNEVDAFTAVGATGVDPARNYLTREVLPRVIERLDPYRPYIASSPYISSAAFESGLAKQGSKFNPEAHLWGPRDYYKSSFYTGATPYFVSETGYHGCPARSSIEKFIDADHVWPYQNNEQWNLHSTDQNNNDSRTMLMHKQVIQMFGNVPTDMDEYILASQLSQAEAKKFFIESMRCKMARNGGVIWWNLIDGWPQMSDAIVDYYYEKKLAYDFIKRSQQPFMIMLDEPASWGNSVICCNSTMKTVSGKCTIYDLDTDEILLERIFNSAPNSNANIGKLPIMYSDKKMLIIKWETGEKTSFNTYLCGSPAFDLEKYKVWLKKINELTETLNQ
jgi:beta-mannosidase